MQKRHLPFYPLVILLLFLPAWNANGQGLADSFFRGFNAVSRANAANAANASLQLDSSTQPSPSLSFVGSPNILASPEGRFILELGETPVVFDTQTGSVWISAQGLGKSEFRPMLFAVDPLVSVFMNPLDDQASAANFTKSLEDLLTVESALEEKMFEIAKQIHREEFEQAFQDEHDRVLELSKSLWDYVVRKGATSSQVIAVFGSPNSLVQKEDFTMEAVWNGVGSVVFDEQKKVDWSIKQ
jgi:hypothetical protein